jgi:hypothetical protein
MKGEMLRVITFTILILVIVLSLFGTIRVMNIDIDVEKTGEQLYSGSSGQVSFEILPTPKASEIYE